ncbi:hypothetical protein NP493_227g03081 [Ridgeia piscesae]|uniref:Death domain-containing protein n=1 Tax=Ridgeia piscesae TaxID=27915 RepID=A0AAD9P029_RIDPI|nr:hypothetical protein NP493_227g03081 [Ridgeia piscesae]
MAHAKTPTRGAASCSDVSPAREMFDNTFLIKFAQRNCLPTEQFQLAALLNMSSSTIDDITRDSKDAVIATFKILEKWVQSRRRKTNVTAMFDELATACVTIKRSDLVDFVRCGE